MATRRSTGSVRTAESPKPAPDKIAPQQRTEAGKPAAPSSAPPIRSNVSEDARRAMVAQAAYLRAERRGFAPGGELEDWMAAEAEVDALLRAGNGRRQQH